MERFTEFWDKIKEEPRDDNARLVFADYLAEQGHEEWGQFIRLQIEMEKSKEDRERLLLTELGLWSKLYANSVYFKAVYSTAKLTQSSDPLAPLDGIDDQRIYSVRGLPSLVVCSGRVRRSGLIAICKYLPITHAVIMCGGEGISIEGADGKRKRFLSEPEAVEGLKQVCGNKIDFRFVEFIGREATPNE